MFKIKSRGNKVALVFDGTQLGLSQCHIEQTQFYFATDICHSV